jgi:ABC-type lipoprotein export system ATPase subunit
VTGDAQPIVRLEGVRKVYSEGEHLVLEILKGIDLQVAPGEIVALRGPSGSGKSTLLNILGCLDQPTSGTYLLGGRDVSTLDATERAWVRLRFLGFIFQSFNLIGHATALENVTLPMVYAGVPRAEREDRARALLARVGLADRVEHLPNQLSGGQKQRVAIARSLAMQPRVLLADEPTGALDTKSGEEVLALMHRLHAETGVTILLVTHDPHVAESAHRTIHLRDGVVVDGA